MLINDKCHRLITCTYLNFILSYGFFAFLHGNYWLGRKITSSLDHDLLAAAASLKNSWCITHVTIILLEANFTKRVAFLFHVMIVFVWVIEQSVRNALFPVLSWSKLGHLRVGDNLSGWLAFWTFMNPLTQQ